MSDSNGPQDKASALNHGNNAVELLAEGQLSSESHDGPARQGDEAASEDVGPRQHSDESKANTQERQMNIPELKDVLPDSAAAEPSPESGSTQQLDDHSARAREIESEASEHLASRASQLSLKEGSGGQADQSTEDEVASTAHAQTNTAPPRASTPIDGPTPHSEKEQEEFDEKELPKAEFQHEVPEAPQGTTEATGAEIQNIMDQFQEGMGGLDEREIMSPRLERQSILVLPPRSSSLEPKDQYTADFVTSAHDTTSPVSPQATRSSTAAISEKSTIPDDRASVVSTRPSSIFQPPPPSPDPEPALPFDFHRFLEQLRHRTADPVARFLRSFLNEFAKKQWMVHEQVKIVSDFLEFITKKMGQCEIWRTVSDAEFDNAREGMEKLVMNRLYSQTFSPAIPPMPGSPRKTRSGRYQADSAKPHGLGRRGQHQEDVERDDVIAQKIKIYGWIREEHLDIKQVGQKGTKFLELAKQELLKINSYRAPRDKVICVLNCCKVIFGFLRNSKSDQSADAFVPLLIYTVLQARPEHLVSNVQYIWRFRNQDKLGGEAGYYMSTLMGVVTFIENLDRTNLTITDEEFEKNVEQAVSAIAEKDRAEEYEQRSHASTAAVPARAASNRQDTATRNSGNDGQRSPRRKAPTRRAGPGSSSDEDDGDAVSGLLRSIQKPLSSIGRIFTDDTPNQSPPSTSLAPARTPHRRSASPRGLSPTPRPDADTQARVEQQQQQQQQQQQRRQEYEVAAARQASVETAQAQKVRVREHRVVADTLQSMFPNLDKEVIEDVVRAQEGHVARAVDACLALSG